MHLARISSRRAFDSGTCFKWAVLRRRDRRLGALPFSIVLPVAKSMFLLTEIASSLAEFTGCEAKSSRRYPQFPPPSADGVIEG